MSGGGTSSSDQPTNPASDQFAADFAAFLRARQALDELSLKRAERARERSGERLDVVLVRLGLMSEAALASAAAAFLSLADLTGRALVPLSPLPPGLDIEFLRARRVVPVAEPDTADENSLTIAAADPFDPEPAAALAYLLDRPIVVAVAAEADIARALDRLAQANSTTKAGGPATRPPQTLAADAAGVTAGGDSSDADVRRLADLASEAPIIRLVQDLIVRATEANASDIHLEPRVDSLRVRLRIDGQLHDESPLPPNLAAAVVSRIKIMAELNIAERRLPQDGRIKINVRGREVDLRISTMPTLGGESVVLRILDRGSVTLDFAALGFGTATVARLTRLLDEPNGLVLVTGPTGSGKTTTLYAALSGLNEPFRKTFTVEDPIEYQLTGVNQIQVAPRIGLSFAHALRSILRQDPDIVMVGEIRDLETAEMAVQAALTGHLVLSTVHTNSAASTVIRLRDMGVEDYLLASTLKGVLAQRLVRRLCENCAVAAPVSSALAACIAHAQSHSQRQLEFDIANARVRRPAGCEACRHTGFRGRLGIAELLIVNEVVRSAMIGGGREEAIEAAAVAAGMTPMLADGLTKVLTGQTTLEDVLRVTRVA